MQLLNVHTLRLSTFYDQDVPRYAILSHTWEDEEILHDDICDPEKPLPQHKKGFFKVKHSCEQAACDEFDWIWIDTCCIDKSSSAELSEAINSMFRWYNDSAVCYAYISDVVKTDAQSVRFVDSRWFTRGWTLQELIAPEIVVFFDSRWQKLGQREDQPLASEIANATGIPWHLLKRRDTYLSGTGLRAMLDHYSVAQRFSWASKRSTKRLEDEAYCLLGIFGVNMPLLYGEGPKAFFRLQQEILRTMDDQSILAFQTNRTNNSLLAESPKDFISSSEIQQIHEENIQGWHISTNPTLTPSAKVLEMPLFLCSPLKPSVQSQFLGVLSCVFSSNEMARPAMILEPVRHANAVDTFYRTAASSLPQVSPEAKSRTLVHINMREADGFYEFDLSTARLRTIRVYFHEPVRPQIQFSGIPTPGDLNLYGYGRPALLPGVRLELKDVSYRYLRGVRRVESHPHSLRPIRGEGQFYAGPKWGIAGRFVRVDLSGQGVTHNAITTFDTSGALFVDMGIPLYHGLSPLIVALWGATWSASNAPRGSYLCLLLDWSKIVPWAVRKGITTFTDLLNDRTRNIEDRVSGYQEVAEFLTNENLFGSAINATIIGAASIERPAVIRSWWGEYIFEVAGDEFMGQPLLDVVLTVKVNVDKSNAYPLNIPPAYRIPQDQTSLIPDHPEVHKSIHELEDRPLQRRLHENTHELQESAPLGVVNIARCPQ